MAKVDGAQNDSRHYMLSDVLVAEGTRIVRFGGKNLLKPIRESVAIQLAIR